MSQAGNCGGGRDNIRCRERDEICDENFTELACCNNSTAASTTYAKPNLAPARTSVPPQSACDNGLSAPQSRVCLIPGASLVRGSLLRFWAMAFISAAMWFTPVNSKCVRPRQDLGYCDMVDYKVYDTLNIPEAIAQASEVGEMHVSAWREYAQQSKASKSKKKKKGGREFARLPFCEDLIKATTCNLLLPPCDGDGTQRYRKPCKAYALALKLGCNWTINVGDLSFAEPPDCFELPIRTYSDAEFLDAAEIGAAGGDGTSNRADDVLKIAALLEEEGHKEHAAFMYLQVLRYRHDDPVAHLRTFAVVHSLHEHVLSLKSQLKLANSLMPSQRPCDAMLDDLDMPEIAGHKGLGPAAKIQYILQYARKKQSQMFYETGVWYGETINGLKAHFSRLVSIEISSQIADLARKRFANDKNVEILTGDSVELLPDVLATRDRKLPAIFWLDGHFSGSRFETAKAEMDTPILAELDMTLAQVENHDVVLIDDARLFQGYDKCAGDFGTECYPTIEDLRRVLCHRQPSWSFHVEDDLVRMEFEGEGQRSAPSRERPRHSAEAATPSESAARADTGAVSGVARGGAGNIGAPKNAKQAGVRGKIPTFGGAGGQEGSGGRGASGVSTGAGTSSGRKVPSFGSGSTKAPPSASPPAQVDAAGAFHIKL